MASIAFRKDGEKDGAGLFDVGNLMVGNMQAGARRRRSYGQKLVTG